MKKTIFMEKYPIYSLELSKEEIKFQTMEEILEYLKEKVENHPIAKYIATFDNYSHTKSLDGAIVDGLKDAQIILFCFGSAIPDTKILAVRPRNISVCEMEDKFIIQFMEAPKEELHNVMESWAKSLKS